MESQDPPSTANRDTERVSHETIYRALYVQTRGTLRKDLYRQLSTRCPAANPKVGSSVPTVRTRRRSRSVSAPQRSPTGRLLATGKATLVMGIAGGVAVGTLVERWTRFTILLYLPGRHEAETVAAAMIGEMSQLPEHLRLSLTWDRGTELARYDKIQTDLSKIFGTPKEAMSSSRESHWV